MLANTLINLEFTRLKLLGRGSLVFCIVLKYLFGGHVNLIPAEITFWLKSHVRSMSRLIRPTLPSGESLPKFTSCSQEDEGWSKDMKT